MIVFVNQKKGADVLMKDLQRSRVRSSSLSFSRSFPCLLPLSLRVSFLFVY